MVKVVCEACGLVMHSGNDNENTLYSYCEKDRPIGEILRALGRYDVLSMSEISSEASIGVGLTRKLVRRLRREGKIIKGRGIRLFNHRSCPLYTLADREEIRKKTSKYDKIEF